jgi:poly [ADP-ribose] polymerase
LDAGDYRVVRDLDVTLNQVNIGSNNNKFYAIQLLQGPQGLSLFTRYGRVGETGTVTVKAGAEKDFESTFR